MASIFKSLLLSLATERFVKSVTVHLLEALAKKTDNSLDDKIVDSVKVALDGGK
jgi:hypothetical protein